VAEPRKRVVLAYSGGLDTSAAVAMLSEEGYEVVAALVDVGQGEDLKEARERALRFGASEALVIDKKEEFCGDYLSLLIRANALYQGRYPLISSVSRPLIAKALVEVARQVGAGAVAHGCTGKGNDQVRFEVSLAYLAPELEVMAPIRERAWDRGTTLSFLRQRFGEVPFEEEKLYSIDQNLWGRAIECGILEDPWQEPPEDVYELTRPRRLTGTEEVIVGFSCGLPVSVDGTAMDMPALISSLEERVGAWGWGRIDMVEDRVVGIKSREVYEAPAALALIHAHRELEAMVLDKALLAEKVRLEQSLADLVYAGHWHSPLCGAIAAFMERASERVTGEVRLRLGPRVLQVTGRRSPFSLYESSLATYGSEDLFDHASAAGFVRMLSLPARSWARAGKGHAPAAGGTSGVSSAVAHLASEAKPGARVGGAGQGESAGSREEGRQDGKDDGGNGLPGGR
jgi:argininosuccinate synthase